jgi:hypothetical protein
MVKNTKRSKSPKKKSNKNDGWIEPVSYGWDNRSTYWNPGFDRRNVFRPTPVLIPGPPILLPPVLPPSPDIRVLRPVSTRIVSDVPIVETSTPCTIL